MQLDEVRTNPLLRTDPILKVDIWLFVWTVLFN